MVSKTHTVAVHKNLSAPRQQAVKQLPVNLINAEMREVRGLWVQLAGASSPVQVVPQRFPGRRDISASI